MAPLGRIVLKAARILFAVGAVSALAAVLAFWPHTRPDPARLALPSTLFLSDREGRPVRAVPDEKWRRHLALAPGEISETVKRAFVAAEDGRFYSHPGIDPLAVARAAATNLAAGRVVSGASTITQQLVKISGGRPERSAVSKIAEAIEAVRLEEMLAKEEILAAYLNRVDLANNLIGIEAASRAYFGKRAANLDEAEAATLAALPKAPTRLDPWGKTPEALLKRRNMVLGRMASNGFIEADEAASLAERPLGVLPALQPMVAPHLLDELAASGKLKGLVGDVRLTLDAELQAGAEAVLRSERNRLRRSGASQAAIVVLDNRDLGVLAMVGSLEYGPTAQGFVNGATARRSAGSTLKPFLYGLAIEDGAGPATVIDDLAQAYRSDEGEYLPLNHDRQTRGPVSMRLALGKSLNLPAVRTLEAVTPARAWSLFRRVGVLSEDSPPPDHYGLGLAVGNPEVRLVDLAAAFAALANGGLYEPPRMLAAEPGKDRARVLTAEAAWLVTDVLSDPLVRSTSFSAFPPPSPCALKTGTSTHYRDGWTVGYTQKYTVGVWVGNFDGRETAALFGGEGAGPVFTAVMRLLYPAGEPAPFPRPPTVAAVEVCAQSGVKPGPACRERKTDYFTMGTEPLTLCAFHEATPDEHRLPGRYASWLSERKLEGRQSRYRLAGLTSDLDAAFSQLPSAPAKPYEGPVTVGAPEGEEERGEASGLRIVYPLDGDRYVIGPTDKSLTLKLRAEAGEALGAVRWYVDGLPLGVTGPPFELAWEAERGRHKVLAVDSSGFGSAIEVSVE